MAKVDCAVRLWEMLFSCVTQGSVLGPLLFNSYMYEICFFKRPANIDFVDMQITVLLTHTLQIWKVC